MALFRGSYLEIEVFSVEPSGDAERLEKPQYPHDILLDYIRRRRSECRKHRALWQGTHELGYFQVAGTEILPPVRNAMRLVDSHQRDCEPAAHSEKALAGKSLRRDVNYAEFPRGSPVEHPEIFLRGEGAVYARSAHAGLLQSLYLVFHQRNKRRNNDGRPTEHERGYLVAHGFSGAGGHYAKAVLPGNDVVDDLPLTGSEFAVPEIPL